MNQATVNSQAEDPEMEQWAYEATAALEAAHKATTTTLERYKEAGEALIKAKKKCGHGKWLPYLKRHALDRSQTSRAMRINSNWSKCGTVTHLKEALALLAKDEEESEKAKPVEKAPLCKRCQNVGPTKDCKACEEAEIEWKSKKKGRQDREPGDDTESEERAKQEEKEKAKQTAENKKANGKATFDWKPFESHIGGLVRSVDMIGNAYGVKESKEADGLRKRAVEWRDDFKSFYEKTSKQKAPEASL